MFLYSNYVSVVSVLVRFFCCPQWFFWVLVSQPLCIIKSSFYVIKLIEFFLWSKYLKWSLDLLTATRNENNNKKKKKKEKWAAIKRKMYFNNFFATCLLILIPFFLLHSSDACFNRISRVHIIHLCKLLIYMSLCLY